MLAPATWTLSALPLDIPEQWETSITDRYQMPAPDSDQPGRLDVVREFRGKAADSLRAQLRGASVERVAKMYLQMYARNLPSLETASPHQLRDDREDNRLAIELHYRIPHPWRHSDAHAWWDAKVQPTLLGELLEKPEVAGRVAPLATPHPASIAYAIEMTTPFAWTPLSDDKKVSGPAFSFTYASNAGDHGIRYDYGFVTTADHVDERQLAAHAAAVDEAAALLDRVVTWRPLQKGVNWWAWLAVLLTAIACAAAMPALYRYSPGPAATPDDGRREPLTGWLALVALRIYSFPIVTVYELWKTRWFFGRGAWLRLVDASAASHRPGLAALILVELMAQTAVLFYSAVVIASMVKRRRAFLVHYTVLAVAAMVFSVLDLVALQVVSPSSHAAAGGDVRVVSSSIVGVLFILYVRLSEQARRTFTRP